MPTRLLKRQVRTIDASTLTTSNQALGAVVTIAAYKISFVNSSTKDVQISDNTTNDSWYIAAGSTLSVGEGLTASKFQFDSQASVPSQTVYQIKLPSGVAGTGTVIMTVLGY